MAEPRVQPMDMKQTIEELFRDAGVDCSRLEVRSDDGNVTLQGLVKSDIEREKAEHIARSVRGVSQVENRIKVEPAPTVEAGANDSVYEASVESFPASDPPAWTGVSSERG